MKNFVKLIQQVHEERFSAVMEKIIARKIPVAFLSLAPVAQAAELVKNIRAQGLNISRLIVIDNNTPPLVNLDFEVVNISDAAQIYPQPEYVFTFDWYDISARIALKYFPTAKVLNLNRGTSDNIYDAFMSNLQELQKVYESLIDEESKKAFCGYWLGNTSCQHSKFVYSNTPHYICTGFIPTRGAIVIDVGVCDGRTSVRFLEMGYKVYGFEMDKTNYEIARKVAEEKNFVVENLGLGSYNHIMTYTHNESNVGASKFDSNGSEITQVITLDNYVREKNLPSVDFIKLDVEGAELDVLRGAATTIARFKPILALSAYHKWDDLWTLINFVKSIRPDYEFAMRHGYDTHEDLPSVYNEERQSFIVSLGLEPDFRNWGECVLFAR